MYLPQNHQDNDSQSLSFCGLSGLVFAALPTGGLPAGRLSEKCI